MKLLIHSQTSTVQPLKFENEQVISCHIYWACDYLSMTTTKYIVYEATAIEFLDEFNLHGDSFSSVMPIKRII